MTTLAREVDITQTELQAALDYDLETGVFRWKVYRSSNAQAGWVAGCADGKGYWVIGYNNKSNFAHRLAWLYMYGKIPADKQIDHIDRNPMNNRISNLRLCSQVENNRNMEILARNTSGAKGVYWHKKAGKWEAQANLKGKSYYLGLYIDKDEAIAAHKSFCIKHHGDFYRDTTQSCSIPP